jgi:hypothetical protein
MKKSKLLAADGSEFTVFFLNKYEVDDLVVSDNLNEMDVNENSCGVVDEYAFGEIEDNSDEVDELMNVKKILKQDLQNYLKENSSSKNLDVNKIFTISHPIDDDPIIDDVIESDIIKTPLVNELYRVRGLNKIARFKGYSQVQGVLTKRYFKMSHHSQEFHVLDNTLIKATELEKDVYLGKSL